MYASPFPKSSGTGRPSDSGRTPPDCPCYLCRAFSVVRMCARTVESLPPLAPTATRSPARNMPLEVMTWCTSSSKAA